MRISFSGERTQDKYCSGIHGRNISPFSKRRYQRQDTHTRSMRCRWLVLKTHTISLPVVRTVWCAVGSWTCSLSRKCVYFSFMTKQRHSRNLGNVRTCTCRSQQDWRSCNHNSRFSRQRNHGFLGRHRRGKYLPGKPLRPRRSESWS